MTANVVGTQDLLSTTNPKLGVFLTMGPIALVSLPAILTLKVGRGAIDARPIRLPIHLH